ncbi:MAG: ATP-grasp domain-containing protein [Candidatus Nitrosocaldaceae archaeon]
MRLLEHQAKTLFNEYGISTPKGYVVNNKSDAIASAEKLGYPVVLKAQLRVGGRGKAGVVVICKDRDTLEKEYARLYGMTVQGEKIERLLVEAFTKHNKEYYISIFLNRSKRSYSLIASSEGGVEIESVKDKIVMDLDLEDTIDISKVANALNLIGKSYDNFIDLVSRLARLVYEKEAELAEINPLVMSDSSFIALDAKVIIDDNALFRHEELKEYEELSSLEVEAKRSGFSLVELEGDIAVIGNGAGLVMSTLDMLSDANGKPACFLDVGGTATTETVYKALTLISKMPRVKAILVNLFGGIVRTSVVAEAIVKAYNDKVINVPLFARILGAESDKAREILSNSNAKMYDSVEDAISEVVKSVRR